MRQPGKREDEEGSQPLKVGSQQLTVDSWSEERAGEEEDPTCKSGTWGTQGKEKTKSGPTLSRKKG